MSIILLFSLLSYTFQSNCLNEIIVDNNVKKTQDIEINKNPIHACNIKVLLNEKPTNHLTISSKHDLITNSTKNSKIQRKISNTLTANLDNNFIYINGKKYTGNTLQIKPADGYLSYENREYHGSFVILKDKNSLLLINVLSLEDYVSVVLRTESWPGWPLEANKILAISIRTYAIDKILEARQKKLPYHIKTTTEHQTYKGILNNKYTATLLKAVKDTCGLIITYNNKPILAMHDSCCAGIIPANVHHIDFKKAPYLARKEVCHHCKISKFYTWETTITNIDLKNLLMQEIPNLKSINNITIIQTDPEGIPQKIIIDDNKSKHILDGKKFYILNKKIRSYYYKIKKSAHNFIISGRGVGHHIGLCQWGARNLVDQGWDCKSIIKFYYPGTSLMKLKTK